MIQVLQILLGFLTLGWNVYRGTQKAEANKLKRRKKMTKIKQGLRKARHEKDTGDLEDILYELGFTGKPYGSKLPTPGEAKPLDTKDVGG